MMAQRLACETDNLFAKVVSYAGVLDPDLNCKKQKNMNLYLVHDLDDNHILYNGMSDEEYKYRKEHEELYPLRKQYISAKKNYENWSKILGQENVTLTTTRGRGHMPKLTKKEKKELIEYILKRN